MATCTTTGIWDVIKGNGVGFGQPGMGMIRIVSIALCLACSIQAADWYAAPTGTDGAAGTLVAPVSLKRALGDGLASPASPGDTVYLRGGTYPGGLSSELAGSSGSPIFVKPYSRELPVIECTATNVTGLSINGSYTQFSGIEIWNSASVRAPRNPGIFLMSPGSKIINCLIHDTGVGIYVSEQSIGAEIYGNLIYNYGDAVLPAKHAIYAHSTGPTVTIKDNVTLNGFYCGIHCYSEVAGELDGFDIIGNTCAEAGSLFGTTDRQQNFLIGGTVPADHIAFDRNSGYFKSSFQDNLLMGYQTTANVTGSVTSNYFGRGNCTFNSWDNMTVVGNSWEAVRSVFAYNPPGSLGTYSWNDNTYASSIPTLFNISSGGGITFAAWKTTTSFDSTSIFVSATSETRVFVRPNSYLPGRALITVFNWGLHPTVSVNLSSVCTVGQLYVIRNAANYYGPIVASFTYNGSAATLPMSGLGVATPVGVTAPLATGPEFNAFILETSTNNPAAPPSASFELRAVYTP